jgi:hypothetical protein
MPGVNMTDKNMEYELWFMAIYKKWGLWPPAIALNHLEFYIKHEAVGSPDHFTFHTMLYCLTAATETAEETINSDAPYYMRVGAMRAVLLLDYVIPLKIDNKALISLIDEPTLDTPDVLPLVLLLRATLLYKELWKIDREHIVNAVNRLLSNFAPAHRLVRTRSENIAAVDLLLNLVRKPPSA